MRVIRIIWDFQLYNSILRRYYKHKGIITDSYFIDVSSKFQGYCSRRDYSKVTTDHYVKQTERFMDYLISQGIANCHGVVSTAAYDACGYGNYIIIDHGNGNMTLYAHMSQLNVGAGRRVRQGQSIGLVGCTGMSTGPHLHFEVYSGDIRIDPLLYFSNYTAAW